MKHFIENHRCTEFVNTMEELILCFIDFGNL